MDEEDEVVLVKNEVAWCGYRDNLLKDRYVRKYSILLFTLKGNRIIVDPVAATYLSEITVYKCKLGQLWPRETSLLLSKNLVYLSLDRNNLESLPNHLSLLRNLKILKLNNNKLKTLPVSFGNFKKLKHIDLSGNFGMKKIPNCVFKMTSLTSLGVQEIGLEYIPAKISLLPLLEFLYLSGNSISSIPSEISEFGNLIYITLDGNPLKNQDVLNCLEYNTIMKRIVLPTPCPITVLIFPVNSIIDRAVRLHQRTGRLQFTPFQSVRVFWERGQRVAQLSKRRRLDNIEHSSLNMMFPTLLNLCLAYIYDLL